MNDKTRYSPDIFAHYQAKAEVLPFTVEAYDRFNIEIKNAIQSASNDEIRLVLAEIRHRAAIRYREASQ